MLLTTLLLVAADLTVLNIAQVAQPSVDGPIYLQVSGSDLDGDGTADDGIVRITCTGEVVTTAHEVIQPRDAASGMASGKEAPKPKVVVKGWNPETKELRAIKPTYDIKSINGARVAADAEGWVPITLGNTTGLCEAAQRATKTRSNIQNN